MAPFLVVTEVFSSAVEDRVVLEVWLAREEWSLAIGVAATHEMTARTVVIIWKIFDGDKVMIDRA